MKTTSTSLHALEITGLHKTYKSGVRALNGIDLCVSEGDFFGLLGPNGAGKSTTIGIVTALITANAGSVHICGYDLSKQTSQAKAILGVVPQEFNFNIFEKVWQILVNQAGYYGVPRKLALQRTEKVLEQLGLTDKRNMQSRELSGGLKRRLMIARALIHEPKLLILDEPTAGVDIEIRRSMWRFLREINQQGTTVILTTHYLEEAENLCRHIAIIDKGKIIAHESTRDLLRQLQLETFVFYLNEPIATDLTLSGYHMRPLDQYSLEVDVSSTQPLNDLFNTFNAYGLSIQSMRNKSNRLEELFLSLTGEKPST